MRSKYMSLGGPIRTGFGRGIIDDPAHWDRALAESRAAIARQRGDNPEHWPLKRKLAICMIARTEWAKDCIAKLSGPKTYASQDDFLYLRQNGLAVKGERWHRLTPAGWRAANKAIFALAGELGMHVPDYHFDSWSEHRARCCCGWSASVNRRSNSNTAQRLRQEFDKHLANPNEWKQRKVTVQEIIDKVGTGTLALFRKGNE